MKRFALAALLALGGCQLAPGYEAIKAVTVGAVTGGIEEKRQYNDLKRDAILAATCDISVGSFGRMSEGSEKEALRLLCDLGESSAIRDAAALMQILRPPQ